MKKMLCVATALTVAMSSFSAFASFHNEVTFSGSLTGPNGYKVPLEDGVETKLTMETGWHSDSNTDYKKTSSTSPLSKTYSKKAEVFDSKATLDMTNVAKEWKAYLDVASSFIQDRMGGTLEEARALAIENVSLTGEYTITITYDGKGSADTLKGIENTLLETATAGSGYSWETVGGYTATDFFEEVDIDPVTCSENVGQDTKTFILKMKVRDDIDKNELDSFFSDANADKKFVLLIPENKVNQTGKYEISGKFEGFVDISVSVAGVTANLVESTVKFGTGEKFTEFKAYSEDTEYVELKKSTPPGGGGGGAGGAGGSRPTTKPTAAPTEAPTEAPTVEPQTGGTSSGAKLDYDNHYAYIIGYPTEDGTKVVRPENNITRAEVATIFFRLLTDESRTKFWTTENDFSDVVAAEWYNNAISTAAQAGIVNGYEDGTFRPNNPITRAEFAAIASRFANVPYDGKDMFSDITGHWAAENINEAAIVGWITGYEDGSFRPDVNITRAEAMTLINRVLYRYVEADALKDDMIKWVDNTEDKWYYANVQEATNSHSYNRAKLGEYETWSAITQPRDWEALEKETSTAASAGKEESVFEGIKENENASGTTMEEITEQKTEETAEETEEVVEETTEEATEEVVEEAEETVEETEE